MERMADIQNSVKRQLVCFVMLLLCIGAWAQNEIAINGHVDDEFGGVPGAYITELDPNDRVLGTVTTDINGNFFIRAKNTRNRIRIQCMG